MPENFRMHEIRRVSPRIETEALCWELIDDRELRLRHPQVRALLCGHVHRFVATLWHGVVATICPSPAHAVALDLDPRGPSAFSLEPPACLIHAWRPEGQLVSHISYIGRFDGPYPFFDAEGRLID